jgi:hypothetical protein
MNMKQKKFYLGIAFALILTLVIATVALADDFSIDNDTFSPGNQATVNLTAAPGATVNTSADIVVDWQGNKHLSPDSTLVFSVIALQTTLPSGYSVGSVSNTVPTNWNDTNDYFVAGASSISFTAPSTAGNYSYTVKWEPTTYTCAADKCLSGANAFTINLEVTAPTNTLPTVNAGGPYSGTEGSAIALTGTASDPDNDPLNYKWTYSVVTADAGAACVFSADTALSTNIKCNDDGAFSVTLTATGDPAGPVSASADLTVTNADPVVATPAWATTVVNCRAPATLTNISFSDAGTIDYPWTVDIDWNDGTSQFTANAQGAQTDQTHTYNTPGTYTATVGVTDKDDGYGDASTTTSLTVKQVYTIDFLPPFDDSTPSGLIVNKMKNGRVVPVKVRIFDVCTQSYVTDPATVTIKVSKTSGTSGTADPVEEYADAGQSSAGTNLFRWTSDASLPEGGFWIYNLDSKALGLVVFNYYRVDVYVGSNQATVSNWAVLQPVK